VAVISAASSFNARDDSIVALDFAQPSFAQVPPLLKLIASPGSWLENSTTTPAPSYLAYKGAVGMPPLVDTHDAWHGADFALALTAKGATWDCQYFPDAEVEPTDYAAIAQWLEALP
jgi:hypothetical protein